MKKTVLIASNLYKPNVGGVENSLHHMAVNYQRMGFRTLICSSDINSVDRPLPWHERENGIEVYRYVVNCYSGPVRFVRHWVNAIRLFRYLRKTFQPTLVISRYHQTTLMLYLAGYRNIQYVVPGVVRFQNAVTQIQGEHKGLLTQIKSSINYNLNLFLQNLAFKKAQRLLVFSNNMLEQVKEACSGLDTPMVLTKPGVDLTRFHPISPLEKCLQREKLGLPSNGPVFLCIGRFVRAKGFDLAIDAMSQIKDAQMWIIGSGALEQVLKEQVQALNLTGKVRILPGTSCPEHYYAAADFFIMSSRYEPLGQTILEALASGLPVIAFKPGNGVVTANEEILGTGYPLMADESTAESLAATMRHAILMIERKEYADFSGYMRELARAKFSWQALCETLMETAKNDQK